MPGERSGKGSFEFRADIREVRQGENSYSFTIGAATDGLVRGPYGPSRLTPRALQGMRSQGVIPIVSGPNHLQGMSDPFTVMGEGVPLESPEGELVVRCDLYPNHPHSADLYDKVQRRPDWYKASIGGLVPPGAVSQRLVRGPEGRSEYERVIDECPLDHIYFCRARSALDKGTWVSAEVRSEVPEDTFAEAVFRAADEVIEAEGQQWPDPAVVDQLEGRAVWSDAQLAAMSDGCFLFIEPSGERHLPVKDPSGNWSCEHLAAAEARADQIVLANGQRISDEEAARLKAEAARLYQEHCATEGRCAIPGAGQGEKRMATEGQRNETESLLARAVVGLCDLLHINRAVESRAEGGTQEPGAEAETPPSGQTPPPAEESAPAAAGPDVAAMLTPVVEGVTAMTGAVQELLAEIKAGKETKPATEDQPGEGAETPEPKPEEKPAEQPQEQPGEQVQNQAGEGAATDTTPTDPAAGTETEEGADAANLQKWFELTANTLQAVQTLAAQVETLTQRLAALEGSRGVSVQPTTPTEKGAQHEHRANTANQHSADTIFRDAAHAAGAVEVR